MGEVAIHTERVDDVPLLLHQQSRMGIPEVVDTVIRTHGNREGLSIGWLSAGWLTYILSQADHRTAEVEPWADQRMQTLSMPIPQPVQVKDFTDDRLADVLRYLDDDTVWEMVETRLGQHLVRVYDLKSAVVRLDSITAAVYHDSENSTLFRCGQSKDHRPDLARFKAMLASLDPVGMPLATLVVPDNESDDGLYVPAVKQARQVVGQGDHLYIGDAKMAALATRASLQADGDYYLTPLPLSGEVPELLRSLIEPVWSRKQALERVYRPATQDEDAVDSSCEGEAVGAKPKVRKELLALLFETTRAQQAQVNGEVLAWQERAPVIYSLSLAKQARQGLRERVRRAEQDVLALTPPRGRGRRQQEDLAELQAAVQTVLKKQRVEGLLEVSYVCEVEEQPIRKYGQSPDRLQRRERYLVEVRRNQEEITLAHEPAIVILWLQVLRSRGAVPG